MGFSNQLIKGSRSRFIHVFDLPLHISLHLLVLLIGPRELIHKSDVLFLLCCLTALLVFLFLLLQIHEILNINRFILLLLFWILNDVTLVHFHTLLLLFHRLLAMNHLVISDRTQILSFLLLLSDAVLIIIIVIDVLFVTGFLLFLYRLLQLLLDRWIHCRHLLCVIFDEPVVHGVVLYIAGDDGSINLLSLLDDLVLSCFTFLLLVLFNDLVEGCFEVLQTRGCGCANVVFIVVIIIQIIDGLFVLTLL